MLLDSEVSNRAFVEKMGKLYIICMNARIYDKCIMS